MKEKISNAFRTKHQRFGLSNEAVDRIASALEKTVTNEEDIETAIASAEAMELIATELQKSADRERRNRSDIQKSFDDYKKTHPETEPVVENNSDDEPEWARKLREQNEALTLRLDQQDRERKKKSTLDSVKSAAQKAGCTDEKALRLTERLFTIKDDETEEDAAARFEQEYNSNVKEYFGGSAVPPAGSPAPFSSERAFHDAMKSYADGKFQGENKE